MANENNQDELNANGWKEGNDANSSNSGRAVGTDFRSEPPKENPFSFKHFLRSDTTSTTLNHSQSNSNIVNGNEAGTSSSNTQSPSKSATTSSLNSTGARPKIPQFQSVSVIHNQQQDSRMKRSPKFSSFDSQSSLSDLKLADERIPGSRSNNSFNTDYQFPSSRSYSNYDIEPSSSPSILDRKPHGRSYASRSQNNNSSNSILPDFLSDGLQDHLLMEYYDNNSANMSPISGDDFSLGNGDLHHNQNGFDLTFNRSPSNRRRNNHQSIPLDLPTSNRSNSNHLPPDFMDNGASNVSVQREETYGPHNEPEITRDQAAIDKMQTLPDFLSDGLIHSSNRLADVATVSHDEDNPIIRLQQENDRLRMIILDLENQISQAKNLETQYNVTLAESMEQVEENLFASNQRAAEAQAQTNKYKQQVKQLTADVQYLRQENEAMREGGAVGGVGTPSRNSNSDLARDLRMAAATAESNLRQLLSGVENLRLIAKTLEQAPNLDENDDFNEGPVL